jgi:glycosyltransferase involved in cell wall biosynthesis
MRVLIVSYSDISGGAAIAAYRLHKALLKAGLDSSMLVQDKISDDHTVMGPKTKTRRVVARIRSALDALPIGSYKNRTETLFSPAWVPLGSIATEINELNPDIVHLHWICGGMMSIEEIAKIKAPIVWSLHDMWTFTGGCHYDEGCAGYEQDCGTCRVLQSHGQGDLSKWVLARKERAFKKTTNVTIVGLSGWIADCAKHSTLFKDKRVVNLPNPIDTEVFRPLDKGMAREMLGIPQDKQVILFGAMGATSDPRKGFKELSEALTSLERNDVEFTIFGSSEPKHLQGFPLGAHYLGHLHDDISLRVLYSAADVTVVPSRQENLSNVIMESLSCGTPVVAFDIGGNSDMIDHRNCGYLATPLDTVDLARGIEWVLATPNHEELCHNAREKVLREFDAKVVAKRYIQLYADVLRKQGSSPRRELGSAFQKEMK